MGSKIQNNTVEEKLHLKLNGRNKASNFIKFNQGQIGPYLNANFLPDFWEVFMRPEMINLQVEYTNIMCSGKRC